jgi:flagellar FliL protein
VSKTATAALPAAGAPPAPARRKSKLLLVLSIAFVLAAGGGGAGWWFLGHGAAAEVKQEKRRPPVFHTLEPFTVNLAEENGDHYLQMTVVYQVADEKAVEQLKTYLPVIRNRILLLLSSKRPSELATPEGKQKLVAELVAAARESIPGSADTSAVSGAYLGAFVIQ